jgi:hypothetical protein
MYHVEVIATVMISDGGSVYSTALSEFDCSSLASILLSSLSNYLKYLHDHHKQHKISSRFFLRDFQSRFSIAIHLKYQQ